MYLILSTNKHETNTEVMQSTKVCIKRFLLHLWYVARNPDLCILNLKTL